MVNFWVYTQFRNCKFYIFRIVALILISVICIKQLQQYGSLLGAIPPIKDSIISGVQVETSTSLFKRNSPSYYSSIASEKEADHKYEVTFTNYGWTTSADLTFSKRIITSEFYNAILSHPRFSSKAWQEANSVKSSEENHALITFLDVDSCLEFLYPKYGIGRKWWLNADTENGRTSGGGYLTPVQESCKYIMKAANSTALSMESSPRNRLIVLDCGGFPKHYLTNICRRQDSKFSDLVLANPNVIIASYSQTKAGTREGIDIGLPPPAIKPVSLTPQQRNDIKECKERKYLFSFQGRPGYGRGRLSTIANETDVFIRITSQNSYRKDLSTNNLTVDTLGFKELLVSSHFAGAPRGDALYTYRFAETLSAGTIPVVYANDWRPPFHPKVVDWNKCAVFIKEEEMETTAEVLRNIPHKKVCEMQNAALQVWDDYISSREGWVNGLVESALMSALEGPMTEQLRNRD